MKCRNYAIALTVALLLGLGSAASAQDIKLLINSPDEPVAKTISFAKSAEFLDHQSRAWTQIKKCGTCHTNFPYLVARGQLGGDLTALNEVRGFFEKRIAGLGQRQKGGPPQTRHRSHRDRGDPRPSGCAHHRQAPSRSRARPSIACGRCSKKTAPGIGSSAVGRRWNTMIITASSMSPSRSATLPTNTPRPSKRRRGSTASASSSRTIRRRACITRRCSCGRRRR